MVYFGHAMALQIPVAFAPTFRLPCRNYRADFLRDDGLADWGRGTGKAKAGSENCM